MLEAREGQAVPSVIFKSLQGGKLVDISSDALFKGRTVIVFSLPGAYTPTCSSSHLPRFNELAPVFKTHGVDEIICMSVNDPFVMDAWGKDQDADKLTLIADGNGEFTQGMGMLVDKSDLGFGQRSWRYSMLVRDGIVEKMFIEPQEPGDPFKVSDADTMLDYLNPTAEKPKFATLLTRPGCPFCVKAKQLLQEKGIPFEEIQVSNKGVTSRTLRAMAKSGKVPQVWIEGEFIGDSEALAAWCANC